MDSLCDILKKKRKGKRKKKWLRQGLGSGYAGTATI